MEPPPPQPPSLSDAELLARYERAMAGSQDGYWERNLRSNLSWYSPSFRAMFGFGPDELPNDRNVINARVHPDDIGPFLASYQAAIDSVGSFTYEVRFLDKQERWRWVRGRGSTWAGPDGQAEIIAGALSDVHREKTTQHALTQMTQRFERAVHAADEALFERWADSDTFHLAPRFAELLGYTPAELGTSRARLTQLMHPDDRDRFESRIATGIAERGRWTIDYRMRCKAGVYRWFHSRAMAQEDANGRVLITGVMADIHEQITAREALQRQQQHLEQLVQERTAKLEAALALAEQRRAAADRASEAKSRFLAHMSHEIRTPLNGVLGLNELALRSAQSPAQRRHLELALQSGRSLLGIINDVLDFSRLEAGKLALVDTPFDLPGLLAQTLRAVMPAVRGKGLNVMFDHIGDITRVRGDPERLRQIATNLLGNAAKFTERGHLALVTTVRPTEPGRCEAVIEFRDTGPGMDAATQARVFDAFVQGDASLTRRHGGTGLGLSIARGLAEAMDGELTLASTVGVGSCFTLRLPLAIDGDAQQLWQPVPGRAWLLYTRPMIGEWLVTRFARLGWHSVLLPGLAAAVAQAQQLAPADHPELVVVAEHVLGESPDLAGLRAALPDARITLLVRPDWAQPEVELSARALAITPSFMPLTPHDLLEMLQPSVGHAALPPITRPGALPRRVMLVEDNPVNRLIGEQMLVALGLEVDSVDGGEAAIAACHTQPPDLMLLDVQMPGLDGHATCRLLRALQQAGTLPPFAIVALTAHALESDRAASLAAGMDGFLTKPIVLEQLRAELLRWLPNDDEA